MPETVVLLHGFGSTRRSWDGVAGRLDRERYLPLALDILGHGDAAAERPITFARCVEQVLAGAPERFALCGYSLGGRIALQVALAAPARVVGLALVSTSAGIENDRERAARRARDHRLAGELERGPAEKFWSRWNSQPLFAADPPAVRERAERDQRRNRPQALAAALRGLGAGQMSPLWDRLGELQMPAVVAVGARDRAYQAHGRRMAGLLPRARLEEIAGGHRLALESPADLARALQRLDAEPRDVR